MVCPAAFYIWGWGYGINIAGYAFVGFFCCVGIVFFKVQDTLPGKSVAGPLVIRAFGEFPGTFAIEFYGV